MRIKLIMVIIMTCTWAPIFAQVQMEVDGKAKINVMDEDPSATKIVVRQADGTLAVRDASSLIPADQATCDYSIGDTVQGGIIFYLDESGCKGLVAKQTDEAGGGAFTWSTNTTITNAITDSIFGGSANTELIISVLGASNAPAANACYSQTHLDYNDWYLPSKDELDLINQNRNIIGGFSRTEYWSSTELNASNAWNLLLGSGLRTIAKVTNGDGVRCIRAFSVGNDSENNSISSLSIMGDSLVVTEGSTILKVPVDSSNVNELELPASHGTNGQFLQTDGAGNVSWQTHTDIVNDADADPANEIQDLSLSGNILTITNNGTATSIDLSAYLDNTDTQLTEAEVDAFVGNNGYLTMEQDGSMTNELELPQSPNSGEMNYWDGTAWVPVPTGTDGQTLTLCAGIPTWTTNGICPPSTPSVTSSTGQIWMDRNLGATQVATSSTDPDSYGDLYQWGRAADGHESRTSVSTSTNATTAVPNAGNPWDGLFITESSSPLDWLTPQDATLWQGVNGTNNPCPAGYRLPTDAEWDAERLSWPTNNSAGAFASPLKVPVAGSRHNNTGLLINVGGVGRYWSSTVDGVYSRRLDIFSNNANVVSHNRAYGFSVRCLKD